MEMQKSLGLAASGAISISAATPGSACQGSKKKLKPNEEYQTLSDKDTSISDILNIPYKIISAVPIFL